jgi:RNA polymerase sigma-70 factor, ECF subfamily
VTDPARRRRLEALFAEHARAVHAYALRRIDPAAADDTVSEVFLVAWRRLDDCPPDALPWLLACARRVLANQRRGNDRRRALTDLLTPAIDAADATDADHATDFDGALALALAELTERDRELLLLIAWDGLDPARAALVLDCSRPTLAVRLHRARRRLAAALDRLDAVDATNPATMEPVR